MPKYNNETERLFIERIRMLVVRNPRITIMETQKALEEHPRSPVHLDKDYINKLLKKIRGERATRLNHYTLGVVLAEFEDESREIKKRLWSIILDVGEKNEVGEYIRRPPAPITVVAAIRELRETSKVLFDKMFDAGVFARQLGQLKLEGKLSDADELLLKQAIAHVRGRTTTENSERPILSERVSG